MENILEIKNLGINFKDFSLKNVNMTLEKGSIMGIIGQNGSGKTTILKTILNSYRKNGGEIKVFGVDNEKEEILIKNQIGYIPAECFLMPNKTIEEHKDAFKNFYKEYDLEIYKSCLKKWKLKYHMTEGEMSTGMKIKAMLALTLPHNPKLLILDEPTAGLDPVARLEFLDYLRDFVKDPEKSIIIATHITADLDKIADFVTLVHDGRIVECLGSDEIQEKYALIKGEKNILKEYEELLVGFKEWEDSFEGLIERENIKGDDNNISVKTPRLEEILMFHIWGKNR